jgi:hypothetical protein
MVAADLTPARKEQIKRKYIQSRRRKTVLPLWYHTVCLVVVIAVSAGSLWLYWKLGLSRDLAGRINVQVLLGILATIVMAAITAYALRKMFPERYFGLLTYWLGAHVYLSALVVVLVVLHAGVVFFGGLFNILLMWSFLLVISTGLVGFAIYKLGAKLLARIEGEGKLIEDIVERRRNLNREVLELSHGGSEPFKSLVRRRLLPEVVTFRFLMRQYLRREPLATLCSRMTLEYDSESSELAHEEQANLRRVIEDLVTVRRLDAEYLLHRLLRGWLPTHIALTAAMWLLIAAHVLIVLYF